MARKFLGLSPLHPESGELLHLDLLRFIASAGIVIAHTLEFYWPPERRSFPNGLTTTLPLFVDVFFVISGFVIAYVYSERMRSPADYGRFLQRRVGRLIPLHLLTFVAAFVLVVAITKVHARMNHPPSFEAECLVKTVFLLHAIVPCPGFPLNGQTWSISAEMAMYAAFPLFLALIGRRPGRSFALAAIAFVMNAFFYGSIETWQGHLTVGRAFPAFLLGMAFFFCRTRVARLPGPHIGLAVTIAVLVAVPALGLYNAVAILMAYLAPMFAVAADMRRGRTPALVTRLAPLGQLTYSVYMLHTLMVMVMLNAIGDKILHLTTVPMIALGLFTYVLLGLVSWASLQLFETPARRWIDRLPIFARRQPSVKPAESGSSARV